MTEKELQKALAEATASLFIHEICGALMRVGGRGGYQSVAGMTVYQLAEVCVRNGIQLSPEIVNPLFGVEG